MTTRDVSLFDDSPWLIGGPDRLGPAGRVPSMNSHEEQLLLHWLGAEWLTGRGVVVDLGCFAGGSTARVAQGMAESGNSAAIHAFDRFGASEWHKKSLLYPAGIAAFEGQDIFPIAQSLLAPWAGQITLHRGEIQDHLWSGEPIELLLMDASKATWALDAMAQIFFPALAKDAVVVVFDLFHWRQPWVAYQMHRLRDHFAPLAHATDHALVMRATAPVTPEALAHARTDGITDAALLAGLAEASTLYSDWGEEARLLEAAEGIERSPGVRVAWKMVPPSA